MGRVHAVINERQARGVEEPHFGPSRDKMRPASSPDSWLKLRGRSEPYRIRMRGGCVLRGGVSRAALSMPEKSVSSMFGVSDKPVSFRVDDELPVFFRQGAGWNLVQQVQNHL